MNPAHGLAGMALAAWLGACSPAPLQPSGEDDPRPAVAAMAEPVEQALPPVLDADGNELDPELADAVREKMASDTPSVERDDDPDAAPADDGT